MARTPKSVGAQKTSPSFHRQTRAALLHCRALGVAAGELQVSFHFSSFLSARMQKISNSSLHSHTHILYQLFVLQQSAAATLFFLNWNPVFFWSISSSSSFSFLLFFALNFNLASTHSLHLKCKKCSEKEGWAATQRLLNCSNPKNQSKKCGIWAIQSCTAACVGKSIPSFLSLFHLLTYPLYPCSSPSLPHSCMSNWIN